MGTPFIARLEPTDLPYDKTFPFDQQPSAASLPRTFLDAMAVRTEVFVKEQKVPQENEFDSDDARCAHWVIYASVNQTVSPAVTDPSTGAVIRPRQSETQSVPIGTVRLVPFPHPPHPLNGGIYIDGELVGTTSDTTDPTTSDTTDPTTSSSTTTTKPTPHHSTTDPNSPSTTTTVPTYHPDRPTTYHNGTEPYIKLGRLAVLPAFRARGIARQLITTALDWMRTHPSYFDPSATSAGFSHLGMEDPQPAGSGCGNTHHQHEPPRWRGLVCAHAQEGAVRTWERCGFKVDEGMGRWMEEGIWHVGMFLRVENLEEEGAVVVP